MKNIKIKETYLLFLIVIGLVSLAVYSTYALFTVSTEINDVVEFTTSLSTNNSMIEYEMVIVPAGETKIIELNIINSYNQTLYYGAWYEMISPSSKTDDIELGLYTDKNATPGSGTIETGITKNLLVGITNNGSSNIMLNIGTVGSLTSNLGLSGTRVLIPSGFVMEVIVTQEYIDAHTIVTTENIERKYTTPEMTEVELGKGTYKLETWGAQGGSYDSSYVGGKGGYSYGTLTLNDITKIYVYVGGQPATNTSNRVVVPGGFNGGGNGYNRYYSSTYTYAQGGGGGSDIRIGTDSLYSRVIVAGGGSGATNRTSGYYGGGSTSGTGLSGYSASQTAAGTNGKFGIGGSATTSGSNYKYGSAGGGGGWYGGGASTSYSDSTIYDTYTGGGSGYVYTSSTASNCPAGCLLNSSYYLTNAATKAGNTSFTDFNGATVTGHSGNGAVKISGSGEVVRYTVPRLFGLDDLRVVYGMNGDLNKGIKLVCADDVPECSLVGTDIIETKTLPLGTHTIYYLVKDSKNRKYKYARNIIVEYPVALTTLANLNLTSDIKDKVPDFSVMSPQIATYKEDHLPESSITKSSSLNSYYITYATSYTFDEVNGYSLVNPQIATYSSIYTSLPGKYVVSFIGSSSSTLAPYTNLSTIYKITAASTTSTTKMEYGRVGKTFSKDDTGIFISEDDLGTTFYFRGGVENNYVKFGKYGARYRGYYSTSSDGYQEYSSLSECRNASSYNVNCTSLSGKDMYWRIIRINGDGTIRMIYDGTSKYENNNANKDNVVTGAYYNEINTDNTYVGYMIGTAGATTYANTHSNKSNSTIKTVVDNWYVSSFSGTTYEQYIADAIYCNDRSLDTRDASYTGIGTTKTYYAAIERNANRQPSFKCANKNDRFTKNNSVLAPLDGQGTNKKLTYPIGLITLDEVLASGGAGSDNLGYYLHSSNMVWTMTPSGYSSYAMAVMFHEGSVGSASTEISNTGEKVRPVITIKANAITGGNGSITTPFTVG